MLKAFWSSIWLYHVAIGSARLSIILQCIRVFPQATVGKSRLLMGSMLTLNCIVAAWSILSSIFTCSPVRAFWTLGLHGHCFDRKILWCVNSALAMMMDFAVAWLPVPWIKQLSLPTKQKMLLFGVFVLAGLPCLLAVIRLQSLIEVADTIDPSMDNGTLAIFSANEVYVAIVCACLPTLKALYNRIRPRVIERVQRLRHERLYCTCPSCSTSSGSRSKSARIAPRLRRLWPWQAKPADATVRDDTPPPWNMGTDRVALPTCDVFSMGIRVERAFEQDVRVHGVEPAALPSKHTTAYATEVENTGCLDSAHVGVLPSPRPSVCSIERGPVGGLSN